MGSANFSQFACYVASFETFCQIIFNIILVFPQNIRNKQTKNLRTKSGRDVDYIACKKYVIIQEKQFL